MPGESSRSPYVAPYAPASPAERDDNLLVAVDTGSHAEPGRGAASALEGMMA